MRIPGLLLLASTERSNQARSPLGRAERRQHGWRHRPRRTEALSQWRYGWIARLSGCTGKTENFEHANTLILSLAEPWPPGGMTEIDFE